MAVQFVRDAEWQAFEKLGLGAAAAPSTTAAKLLVATYRLLGFAILTAIVVALVGYISITLLTRVLSRGVQERGR